MKTNTHTRSQPGEVLAPLVQVAPPQLFRQQQLLLLDDLADVRKMAAQEISVEPHHVTQDVHRWDLGGRGGRDELI